MHSPFPGMDPWLEGYLWPDVHHSLASVFKELLIPQISPRYVARIDLYTVQDTQPEQELGIMYPDVEILKQKKLEEPAISYGSNNPPPITPANFSIPDISPIEVRIPVVEIRDRENNQLITAIEILSPVNKREPGLSQYRAKRVRLRKAAIHLLELDLLRRGTRTFPYGSIPETDYLMSLIRAGSTQTDVWTLSLKDKLPVLPVPLMSPDLDARLDVGEALRLVYERSQYHLSIDYKKNPPPPVFDEESKSWISRVLSSMEK